MNSLSWGAYMAAVLGLKEVSFARTGEGGGVLALSQSAVVPRLQETAPP